MIDTVRIIKGIFKYSLITYTLNALKVLDLESNNNESQVIMFMLGMLMTLEYGIELHDNQKNK